MKLSVYAEVKNRGWEAVAFDLTDAPEGLTPESFTLTAFLGSRSIGREIRSLTAIPGGYHIDIAPIYYNGNFRLEIRSGGDSSVLTKDDVPLSRIHVKDLDKFSEEKQGNVVYRLYSPKADGPRPLILFLHGGGECGCDNIMQMTGTLGAMKIAEMYPYLYVMAPQAPGSISAMLPDPSSIERQTFTTPMFLPGMGWHEEYLAEICDIIRGMIKDGRVNPDKVFVTGLSMGGCGTIRAMKVGGDLFVAAAPICPAMIPDTFQTLCSLTEAKIWVSTAYVDHTFYRHKYIVDAIMKLKDAGNRNAHLTLYSPEDFEKYGFSDMSLPLMERFSENHNAWVLTYNNEYGIMDWLVSQYK